MKKDAAARAAILAALERQLKKGDKTLVGNKGYRRFLATPDDDHFVIDRAKAEEDAKFDGIFVLRTNADLSPLETMLCYTPTPARTEDPPCKNSADSGILPNG